MQNLPESSKIRGFQSKKYDATIRPFSCLSIPRSLLAIDFTDSEFRAFIKLWEWYQNPKKVKQLEFRTSRAQLAEVASCSEGVARCTLQKLKRANALKAINTKFGISEYVWTIEEFEGGVVEKRPAPGWNLTRPWSNFDRPLVEIQPASILYTLYIPFFIPSYTRFSGHQPGLPFGENNVGLRPGLKVIKDALRAGCPKETIKDALRAGLPVNKITDLVEAIITLWNKGGRGGTFHLHQIILLLETWQVDLWTRENLIGWILTLLQDPKGQAIDKGREKKRDWFYDDDDLLDHYYELTYQLEQGGNNVQA